MAVPRYEFENDSYLGRVLRSELLSNAWPVSRHDQTSDADKSRDEAAQYINSERIIPPPNRCNGS
jgi:hypothetical protein